MQRLLSERPCGKSRRIKKLSQGHGEWPKV
jgi:hypothetical protein